MSAWKKLLVISSWLLVFLLLPTINYQQLTTYAVGVDQGDACTYKEEQNDGIYNCNGVYFYNIPDEGISSGLTCKFDESGQVTPDCKKDPNQPAAGGQTGSTGVAPSSAFTTTVNSGTNGAPETPSPANWDPFKQTAFSGLGLVNMASCFGAAIPFGTNGCPQVTVNSSGLSQVMIFHNGEGGGALGAGTHFIAQMYENPPASGIQYMASAIHGGLSIGKPVYAAVSGSGAGVIAPVEKIWTVFRNVAYLFFVIIFVVAGLMIMFRARLNPQTVVSLQTALPGLVLGLILVTFSYFISGLIIDLAFVGSHVIGILFLSQVGGNPVPKAIEDVGKILNEQNVVQMFNSFMDANLLGAAGNLGTGVYESLVQNPANRILAGIIGALAACLNPGALGAIATGTVFGAGIGGLGVAALLCGGGAAAGATAVGGVIISGIVYLILLFGLLQAVFRLLFNLIGAYVSIVISTIFSPFIIMWSSIPGQGTVLGLWWRSLLANVLIFPTVFGLFLLIAAILGKSDNNWHLGNPGTITDFKQTLPLLGGGPVNMIQALLAYGLLLASPGIPDFVREMFHARPNQILNQAISRGFGTGTQTTLVGATRVAPAGIKMVRTWPIIRNLFP